MTAKSPLEAAARLLDAVALMRSVIDALPGLHGTVECAECGEPAKWRRAANGHIWCTCPTPECVRWIE